MEDSRNLIDELKGLTNEQVFDVLSKKRNNLEIAIENVEYDFNIGSIEENQLSDNNLIENSNENYDSLMEVSSNEDSLLDDSLNKSNTSNPSKNNKIQTKVVKTKGILPIIGNSK